MANEEQLIQVVKKYKSVFGSEDGKRVLWDIMKSSQFMGDGFVAGDPYATAYNSGARSVALRILNLMDMDAEQVMERIKEQRKADTYEWQNII